MISVALHCNFENNTNVVKVVMVKVVKLDF